MSRHRWRRAVAGVAALLALCTVPTAGSPVPTGPPNGLARTPPMGLNGWNAFGCDVDEALVHRLADQMVASGLRDAGYRFVNVDDCWMLPDRSPDGHLVPDPARFPGGMAALGDYLHARGLRFGLYSSAGYRTCAGFAGSLGHERVDAADFAAWGVDYLKYDNCYPVPGGPKVVSDLPVADHVRRFTAMRDALAATGRPIVYSVCQWGEREPWTWAAPIGNLWRTTADITASWSAIRDIVAANAPLAGYAGPGTWNDPDMLEVGNPGLSPAEARSHFGMWAMMAAPLLIGTDLRTLTPEALGVLTNRDVIAVDQDERGIQGRVVAGDPAGRMVLSKPLRGGDVALAFYNPADEAATMGVAPATAGLPPAAGYTVRDLWRGSVTTAADDGFAVPVAPHDTVLLRITPAPAAGPGATATGGPAAGAG